MGLFTKIMAAFHSGPSCEDVSAFLDDYLDGELDSKTLRQFETHLMKCPMCPKYLEQYRMTVKMVSEDHKTDVPPRLVEHTLSFLRDHLNYRR